MEDGRVMFLGNLDWWVTENEVTDLCSRYGNVESVVFAENPANGRSMGFCRVVFKNGGVAEVAIAELDKSVPHFSKDKPLMAMLPSARKETPIIPDNIPMPVMFQQGIPAGPAAMAPAFQFMAHP